MAQKTILLVEDDFLNRRLLKKVLKLNGYIVFEAKNSKEAMEILKKEIIALAILDINLNGNEHEGIILGQFLKDKYGVPFIYLTSNDTNEVIGKAISTLPYSYLTKPFKDIDLVASVEIALRQSGQIHVPSIMVKDGDYNVPLAISEIDYVVSEGNYLLLHTGHKIYKLRSTIRQILDTLPEHVFLQVHRAYVINATKIVKYKISSVIIGCSQIPVSRKYVSNLYNFL